MESSDAAQPNVGNAGLSRRALPSLQLPSASGSQAVTNEAAFTTSSQVRDAVKRCYFSSSNFGLPLFLI